MKTIQVYQELKQKVTAFYQKLKLFKNMKIVSSWEYSGKGLFYGVKLHLTSDLNRKISISFASF